MAEFRVPELVKLLGLSYADARVRGFFGEAISRIVRDEFYGSLEYKHAGVEAVFREAPWVLPADEIADPKGLYVSAFHLHREGHDGYSGFGGALPNGVQFGDSEVDLRRKLGPPTATGGGGGSSVLRRRVPHWLRYAGNDAVLHFQLDDSGKLEMITLAAPDVQAPPRATTGTFRW
jgi:hypothetical protein